MARVNCMQKRKAASERQRLRNLDCRGLGCSEHVAKDAVGNGLGFSRGDVGVSSRGTDMRVPKGFLHERQISAVAKQMARIAVFQNMNVKTTSFHARQFS